VGLALDVETWTSSPAERWLGAVASDEKGRRLESLELGISSPVANMVGSKGIDLEAGLKVCSAAAVWRVVHLGRGMGMGKNTVGKNARSGEMKGATQGWATMVGEVILDWLGKTPLTETSGAVVEERNRV